MTRSHPTNATKAIVNPTANDAPLATIAARSGIRENEINPFNVWSHISSHLALETENFRRRQVYSTAVLRNPQWAIMPGMNGY